MALRHVGPREMDHLVHGLPICVVEILLGAVGPDSKTPSRTAVAKGDAAVHPASQYRNDQDACLGHGEVAVVDRHGRRRLFDPAE